MLQLPFFPFIDNCPNWCDSCVPTEQRCDLYTYFSLTNMTEPSNLLKFNLYKQTLCIPEELEHQCNNTVGADLFCSGYVSDGDEKCKKSCESIVNNSELCSCISNSTNSTSTTLL